MEKQTKKIGTDFVKKAEKNIKTWGLQDLSILGLAIAEETGELCQAILKYITTGFNSFFIKDIEKEAKDLGALCVQVLKATSKLKGVK